MDLIDIVEDWRIDHDLTQTQMAVKLGMQSSSYSEFISGRRRLPLGARKRAYKLGLNVKILLGNN